MRRSVAALLTSAAFMAAPAVVPAAVPPQRAPIASIAKQCSASYTRARIGGHIKCLRSGEYCAKRYRKRYRHYGYVCRRLHGVWRLR